jgi:hypothetical protein
MVCHCSVPDGLLQPEAGVLDPATPLYPANATGPFDPAKAMTPPERRQLALEAVAETATVSHLARRHAVSRKFVCRQAAKAEEALDAAFAPADPDDQRVLFQLPVTKPWLRQLILGLTLICHSSLRGVVELLGDVFDYPISVGTVHNVLQAAVAQARACNKQQDLAGVRIGAHDEIFQSSRPVLVGIDADSTYCYLLSLEDHRDAETWGVRLLELQAQGFQPEATIADAGKGIRAGQALAMPEVPCRGDVFHALQIVQSLATFLENRAYGAIAVTADLQRKQARLEWRGRPTHGVAVKLGHAKREEAHAVALAADVATLLKWLREDVLSVAGPDHATRCQLFDFLVAELRSREPFCPHRIKPVVRALANQRDDLLAFASQLDRDLTVLAAEFQIAVETARSMLNVELLPPRDPSRWGREAALRSQLGGRYFSLRVAAAEVASQTVRASSLVENLNSRLRNYFFLRRHLGPDYLALLQFFINHRRFVRSQRPERAGKSPAELLSGSPHPHWLEMLGYKRFSRN